VQLGNTDLTAADSRRVMRTGWIGQSVHGLEEAEIAVKEGADFLVVGTIFETPSHPGRSPGGLALVTKVATLGLPVIAIGGMTPDRAKDVRAAGGYGVAAIRALWHAPDPAAATLAMLQPWTEDP
jgi:thiamine-phosphate diphosphorylase